MCFSSPKAAPVSAPAPAPPPPAIPATQSSTAIDQPVQQIGYGRKRENKRRFGNADGPTTRRDTPETSTTPTGSGIRM